MSDFSQEIIDKLKTTDRITSEDITIPEDQIHGVVLSLESKGQIVFSIEDKMHRSLTAEGEEIMNNGSHEYNLYKSIPEEGTSMEIFQKYPLGGNHALKNKWLKCENERVIKIKNDVVDEVAEMLKNLNVIEDKDFNGLKKRNLVVLKKKKLYIIKKGPNFGNEENYETELTAQMIQNFSGRKFKKYNFESIGNIPHCGALHPLMKIREEFKRIFIELGFVEMKTNRYVESSFWNFDSLFQPQNHPSRESHDTFFLKTPAVTEVFDEEYLEKVKKVHSEGGYGSIGHQSEWSKDEAMKNILRTHTTSVSSRYLKQMANDFKPIKLFSIDKVFRNESVDATHLAEFHQVEGLIAGYNLGIAELMGFLAAFFEKLGLKNIKFKPAFNPYTEPSMEVFGYHEGLKKWIEIGNSGIFRPEMLRPMGYPEDVTVIAWGLSLERPAMIKYGLNNIRDLVGHKVDINFIKNSPFILFN